MKEKSKENTVLFCFFDSTIQLIDSKHFK